MNIRTMAAVWAAKSAGFICRKMGRQGVTWAGKIALKINPHILEDLFTSSEMQAILAGLRSLDSVSGTRR